MANLGSRKRTSQKAKGKLQKAKAQPPRHLSWISVVVAGALPFAFCILPFALFFRPSHDPRMGGVLLPFAICVLPFDLFSRSSG
jgi:hypothetical protein